jgi:hypothetical protein
MTFIPSQKSILNDKNMVPDAGSTNPFLVGAKVNATQRNYTAWYWPDDTPVPAGLNNVVEFPTAPVDPTDANIRFAVVMRMYQMQSGYNYNQFIPTVQAVSAANPTVPVPCPVSVRSAVRQTVESALARGQEYGPVLPAPEPAGNRILFSRLPTIVGPYPEGLNPDGAVGYLGATLDPSKISVVTKHKTPTFFDNQNLPPDAVFGNYQMRYMSNTILHFPEYGGISVNSDNAVYRPDTSWVTVVLPNSPRLSPSQIRAVRTKAAELRFDGVKESFNQFMAR